jgi:hypothetical protein
MAAMRRTLVALETEGKMQQAKELSEHIQRMELHLAEGTFPSAASAEAADDDDDVDLDFENPSEEMTKLAAQMGIDLSRPDVLNELGTLNAQQKRRMQGAAAGAHTSAAAAAAAGQQSATAAHQAGQGKDSQRNEDVTIDELAEHIGVMPLPELIAFLEQQELMTAKEAEGMDEADVRSKAIRMLRASEDPTGEEKKSRALMIRYIILALVFVFAIYRLHAMGILQWLVSGVSPAAQRMQYTAEAIGAAGAAFNSHETVVGADLDGFAEVNPDGVSPAAQRMQYTAEAIGAAGAAFNSHETVVADLDGFAEVNPDGTIS